jgi:hypothetical protein
MEYRKFYLKPGQQAPEGSTGRGLLDGGIEWVGETFPSEIESLRMTQTEIDAPAMLAAKIQAEDFLLISLAKTEKPTLEGIAAAVVALTEKVNRIRP